MKAILFVFLAGSLFIGCDSFGPNTFDDRYDRFERRECEPIPDGHGGWDFECRTIDPSASPDILMGDNEVIIRDD